MKGKNKKTYRRKKLDIVKTLKAYENRIMSLELGLLYDVIYSR